MFPGMPVQANKQERKLVKLYKSLNNQDKKSLLSFAAFLQSQQLDSVENDGHLDEKSDTITEPLDIPRPDNESVVKAIKRLSATYPMVDKENILHPISGLMTSHIMQGRKANDVIDELETLFLKEYKNLKNNNKDVK